MTAPSRTAATTGKDLPEGWVLTTLGAVTVPSREKVEPDQLKSVPYLSLEHIESNTTRILCHGLSSEVKSTKSMFRAGDVLYGKLRPYLNKVCVPTFDGVCSTDILVFPKSDHIENKFLMWFLTQPAVVSFANHNASGVQLPRVSFSKLADLDFPLPPLAEQRRIVAKVEPLLARVNAARERLAKVPAILKRFRQSVLAAACVGWLTEDWRESNGEAGGVSETSELPPGWHRRTITEVASREARSIQSGPFGSNLHHSEFRTGGRLVIGIDNVGDGRFLSGRQHRITEAKYKELEKYAARPLDVLITVMATVGRVCVVPDDIEPAIITKHVYRVTANKAVILPHFLHCVLRGDPSVSNQIRDSIRGQTRPGINGKILKSVEIPVPPIPEQTEIIRRVDALFKLADAIERRVAAATARGEKLTQAILAKAFRGELVPTEAELARREGRTYEPLSLCFSEFSSRGAPR